MTKKATLTFTYHIPAAFQGDFHAFAKRQEEKLSAYNASFEQTPRLQALEESFTSPSLESWKSWALEKRKHFDTFVFCGVGGSSLGARMLAEALGGDDAFAFFLDNIDEIHLARVQKKWDLSRTLFLFISKSGKTIETIAQYLFFRELLSSHHLPLKKHMVFITEEAPENLFWKEAKSLGADCFSLLPLVGGRFSVGTSVGVIPGLLLGLPMEEFLKGMRDGWALLVKKGEGGSSAFTFALFAAFLWEKHVKTSVIMPYLEVLFGFSFWASQLLAESTGKQKNGTFYGITPLPSRGVSDQHSLLQLYLEGPRDKWICLIETGGKKAAPSFPENHFYPFLKGKTFEDLLFAELQATKEVLKSAHIPLCHFMLPEMNAYFLGQLVSLFMGSVAYLGFMWGIDVFSQPAVEKGKQLIPKYLS